MSFKEDDSADLYLGLSAREVKAYSFFKAMMGKVNQLLGRGHWEGLERECHDDVIKRKLADEPINQGIILVPRDVQTRPMRAKRDLSMASNSQLGAGTVSGGSFIEGLYQRAIIFGSGCSAPPQSTSQSLYPTNRGHCELLLARHGSDSNNRESTDLYQCGDVAKDNCLVYRSQPTTLAPSQSRRRRRDYVGSRRDFGCRAEYRRGVWPWRHATCWHCEWGVCQCEHCRWDHCIL